MEPMVEEILHTVQDINASLKPKPKTTPQDVDDLRKKAETYIREASYAQTVLIVLLVIALVVPTAVGVLWKPSIMLAVGMWTWVPFFITQIRFLRQRSFQLAVQLEVLKYARGLLCDKKND